MNRSRQTSSMNSIFRLEEIRAYAPDEHWRRDADIDILGHYSSVEKAVEALHENSEVAWDADDIMAYMVKEISVDGDIGNVFWLSVRTYDPQGNLIGQCLQDYNLCNQFEGRKPEAIRFKIGDIVEILEGRQLFPAIVAALPSTPEDNFPELDAEDDCYLVLPLDSGHIDHLHIPPTHTFHQNFQLEEKYVDYFQNRLLRYFFRNSFQSLKCSSLSRFMVSTEGTCPSLS